MVEIRFKPGEVGSVPDGYITEAKLADNSVTSPKIKDGEIGNDDIAPGASIDESKLNLNYSTHDTKNVAGSRISGGDVPSGLLAGRPVDPDPGDEYYATDEDKVYECLVDDTWVEAPWIRIIKDDAVTGPKIKDGEVIEVKLADGSVSSPKVKINAIIGEKIADGAVVNLKIGAGAVTLDKVQEKTFVKADSLSGDKKVLAMGYDTATEEVVLDTEA